MDAASQAQAARDARRQAREAATTRLLAARARLAEQAQARYDSGVRLAARDSDRLEGIARRIVAVIDAFEIEFDRLDVARDVCAY